MKKQKKKRTATEEQPNRSGFSEFAKPAPMGGNFAPMAPMGGQLSGFAPMAGEFSKPAKTNL